MELILGLDERSGLSYSDRDFLNACSKNCTGHDPEGILGQGSIARINDLYYEFFIK